MIRTSKAYQRRINDESISVARVAVAYAGTEATVTEDNFLPFKREEVGQKPGRQKLSAETTRILLALVREKQIPDHIFSAAGPLIDTSLIA